MFKKRVKPLEQGIFTIEGKNEYNGIRFQFRVEKDLQGVCIIDANRIIYLNNSGIQFARLAALYLESKEAVNTLKYLFKAKPKKLKHDYIEFKKRFKSLVFDPPSAEMFLNVKPIDLFKDNLSAPYRADLAVTYKCDNQCSHCYVDESRKQEKKPELDSDGLKRVIDKIVEVGIPHIIFTGGEPTLRDDLPELMISANDKGVVTGLNTNGRKLANKEYAQTLVNSLLDHVQITLLSSNPKIHNEMVGAHVFNETVQGIKNMIELDIPTITNTTLTKKNKDGIIEMIKFLGELGLTKFAVNCIIKSGGGKTYEDALEFDELEELLKKARITARENEMVMIWYSPTRYCDMNPMSLGLGLKRCTAAHLAVCIEPNADVLPCQSYYHTLGNILDDNWRDIWNHELALKLRNNDFAPKECRSCDLWTACAGGCALESIEGEVGVCQEIAGS